MVLKKTLGALILLLNIGGIGFLFYMLAMFMKDKFSNRETSLQKDEEIIAQAEKTPLKIENDDIIPDEDDLLKDMDLSDLDNLNLDDFD